jgi:heme oxygenase
MKEHARRHAAWWGRHEFKHPGRRLSAVATAPVSEAPATLHALLRTATAESHARLHLHAGFKAIQDNTISLAAYRALLARLLGFYLPFEAATGIGNERSAWLAADLRALGAAPDQIALCPAMPGLATDAARLGAAYMAEGSLLGGRDLARKLDHLLGEGVLDGRRFFTGRGAATGAAWRDFLTRLAAAETGHDAAAAAAASFSVFESWMGGWRAA